MQAKVLKYGVYCQDRDILLSENIKNRNIAWFRTCNILIINFYPNFIEQFLGSPIARLYKPMHHLGVRERPSVLALTIFTLISGHSGGSTQ